MSAEAISEAEFIREYTRELHSKNAAVFAGAGLSIASPRPRRQRRITALTTAQIRVRDGDRAELWLDDSSPLADNETANHAHA